jgi:hypothetical protein
VFCVRCRLPGCCQGLKGCKSLCMLWFSWYTRILSTFLSQTHRPFLSLPCVKKFLCWSTDSVSSCDSFKSKAIYLSPALLAEALR